MSGELRALGPGRADVYWAPVGAGEGDAPPDVARQLSLLSADERARHDRLLVAARRDEFRVAHALLRRVLSGYRAVAPAEWRFREEQHGRPEIDDPPPGPRLRFNLSHTDGLVACVVAEEASVGIDVESVDRQRRLDRIAARSFSADERARLEACAEPQRRAAFVEIWTLKEAQLKAFGTGLQLPMRELDFQLDAGDGARMRYPGAIRDDAARWQHRRLRPSARHYMAVAVECDGPVELRVERRIP